MNDYYRGYRHTQTGTYLTRRGAVVNVQESLLSEDLFTPQLESTSPTDVKTVEGGVGVYDEKVAALRYAAFSTLDGVEGDINEELSSAVRKHGIFRTPFNPEMDVRDAYIILAEEVGEVARALTYDEGNTIALYDELIQVAAMASAMAVAVILREEALDG